MPLTHEELDYLVRHLSSLKTYFTICENIEDYDTELFLHTDHVFTDEEYDEICDILDRLDDQ
jgi:hypothetical protein